MNVAKTKLRPTVLPVLIVLLILVLLAGGYLYSESKSRTTSPDIAGKTKSQMNTLRSALEHYCLDHGRYPSTDEGLVILTTTKSNVSETNNQQVVYFKSNEIPKDGWGHEFVYQSDEKGYKLQSSGYNGIPGDADDLYIKAEGLTTASENADN